MFEPKTGVPAEQQRSRVALKDVPWSAPSVSPSKSKGSIFRSGGPRASLPGAGAEPGSCGNADECALLLRLMVEDPTRSWIGRRPKAAVYANGTRLFAYLALRAKLNCGELALAIEETQVRANFPNGSISGMTIDQVARVRALNARVNEELRAEYAERCKSNHATPSG